MKTFSYWVAAFVAGTMMLSSCSGNGSGEAPETPEDHEVSGTDVNEGEVPAESPYTALRLTPAQEETRKASNDFAVSLMGDVMAMQQGESTVLSPFSLYTTLSMVANGDDGETRDRILETLGFGNGEAGLAMLNDFSSFMTGRLADLDTRAYALVSNSVWIGRSLRVLPSFTDALSRWYGAEARVLPDLKGDAARQTINEWCAEKTRGMVPEFLLQNLGDSTVMAVVNATYFRGMWADGFDRRATEKAVFHNLDGSGTRVDMMKRKVRGARYARTDAAAIVGLDYGNGNFRMTCVLPDGDIRDYVKGMTGSTLEAEISKTVEAKCMVRMPKFDVGSRQDITELLARRGLGCMMNPGFNAISPDGRLKVSKLLQEARVSTDEGGTTGAAVTMAEFAATGTGEEPQDPEVTLDRPFLFVIEETSTGTILFIGAVTRL